LPSLKVALCQMTSTDSEEKNLIQINELIDAAGSQELICFPENSLYMRVNEGAKIPGVEISSKSFSVLSEKAKAMGANFHFGSVPLRDGGKLKNASIFIDKTGAVKVSYTKIHLFDIRLEGRPPVLESDVFSAGADPAILKIRDWNIGQTICYDLRFAELFNYYAYEGCEVILVPAAFLVETGRVHWEVLLRARAIESQTYILAAAQAGTHVGQTGGQRETFGHSMIIGPWGEVVAQAKSSGPEVVTAVLEHNIIMKVRTQIPMKSHRRFKAPQRSG
jgi:deaminated glutathione amidase